MINNITQKQKEGFALLLTLIVVSIVLAIGLSILNITLKQFVLSATSRDSEVSFHAANTGLECMQYHRADDATRDVLLNDDGNSGTDAPTLRCANVDPISEDTDHYLNSAADEYVYNYQYTYEVDANSCIETSIYLMDARENDNSFSYTIDEGLDSITCAAGTVCTTIFSRGFNRSCNDLDSVRVVQRELTIQF